jgi:hypothetical protein
MLPSSKTSYIEENTKTGKEDRQFNTEFTLKRLATLEKRLGALRRPEKLPAHSKGPMRMVSCKKVTFHDFFAPGKGTFRDYFHPWKLSL